MRILHLIDTLGAGGKERQLLALLKGLKNRHSYQSDVVILSDRVDYRQIWSLAHVHMIRRRFRKDPAIFIKLIRLIRDLRPDVVHSWEMMSSVYAIPAVKLFRIPFVNGIVRNAPLEFRFGSPWGILFFLTYVFSDMTLSNSLAGLKAYKLPSRKTIVISNGFDDSRLALQIDPDAVRKQWNLGRGPIVGMTANFTPVKDHPTVIDAGLQLMAYHPDLTFVFIGDGPRLDRMRQLVPIHFKDRFRFIGKQSQVESICQVSDIGLLASFEDGISNALMEYMAFGKPVIAYRRGGNSEIIRDGFNGYLISPRDSRELAVKIRYLLDNPEIARKMGQMGRRYLKEKFSLELMVNNTLRLYRRLIYPPTLLSFQREKPFFKG